MFISYSSPLIRTNPCCLNSLRKCGISFKIFAFEDLDWRGRFWGLWVTVGEESSPRDGVELISCWLRVARAGIKDMNRELMQKILTPLTLSPLWALSFVAMPFVGHSYFQNIKTATAAAFCDQISEKMFLPQWQAAPASLAGAWPQC